MASDGRAATNRGPVPASPDEAARRAAALEALSKAQPTKSAGATFWERHGRGILVGGALLLVLLLITLAVGKFVRTSISETGRSEQELRRGMR